jgi:D-3-phosphoglycerate dehydrogenase
VNCVAVAEQTIGLMIGLSRNLFSNVQLLRQGAWNKNGGRSLSDLRVGVIGVGFIGKAVVRALEFFGAEVLCHDIVDIQEFASTQGADVVSLDELLQKSDIVSLHVPLTDLTREMICKRTLSIMRPGSMLVNTARGEIIQMDDLYESLKSGHLAAAALDVFPDEPFLDRKFLEMKNVICTPHTSGNSEGAILAMGRAAIEHVRIWQASIGRVG